MATLVAAAIFAGFYRTSTATSIAPSTSFFRCLSEIVFGMSLQVWLPERHARLAGNL